MKKTSTKKTAKTTKKAKAAKPVTKTSECPKGGAHEWTEENGETFCSKCKEPKSKKAKPAKPEKKVSALDATAQVLESSNEQTNTKSMIEAMATKGLWTRLCGH